MKQRSSQRRRQIVHDRRERHIAIARMRAHFIRRMASRAPGIDARALFDQLCVAISVGLEGKVEKVCRLPGRRECWRFRVAGAVLYCVFDARFLCPVTVMPAGYEVPRIKGRKRKRLKAAA